MGYKLGYDPDPDPEPGPGIAHRRAFPAPLPGELLYRAGFPERHGDERCGSALLGGGLEDGGARGTCEGGGGGR